MSRVRCSCFDPRREQAAAGITALNLLPFKDLKRFTFYPLQATSAKWGQKEESESDESQGATPSELWAKVFNGIRGRDKTKGLLGSTQL